MYVDYLHIMDLMNSRKIGFIKKRKDFFCVGFWSFELLVLKHACEGLLFETWTLYE